MHRLILSPINFLTKINQIIKSGRYRQRLHLPHKTFPDEFQILEKTYNDMLNHIELNLIEIKQQKDFLQTIIDNIPDAIRIFDFKGNILLVNQSYSQQLNQDTAQTCLGKKCYTSLLKRKSPCTESETTCPLKQLQNHKTIKFIQQVPFQQNSYFSVNAAVFETATKPLIIESFRNLSDNIKFSHQQKVASLGFLSASIAHEIKNNLGSMRLIMETIINNKLSSKQQKDYIGLIYSQLLECIKIPERLLKLTRFSSENNTDFNCCNSISDVCALLSYETKRNGISLEYSSNIPTISICGNETDFKMIIINLLQNAIKAMPNGGQISITSEQDAKHCIINISDTGTGMNQERLSHIFEPFYSSSDKSSNTGLGLAIVKSLVNNLKGKITVKSKEGVGTCFCLKLPYNHKK